MRHKRTLLMNAANMPQAGEYKIEEISKIDFFNKLASAQNQGCLISYIGYKSTVDFIYSRSGIRVSMSRDKTVLKNGDTLLIIKLKYRVNPEKKRRNIRYSADDYEYFLGSYTKNT